MIQQHRYSLLAGNRIPRPGHVTRDGSNGREGDAPRDVDGNEQGAPVPQHSPVGQLVGRVGHEPEPGPTQGGVLRAAARPYCVDLEENVGDYEQVELVLMTQKWTLNLLRAWSQLR